VDSAIYYTTRRANDHAVTNVAVSEQQMERLMLPKATFADRADSLHVMSGVEEPDVPL